MANSLMLLLFLRFPLLVVPCPMLGKVPVFELTHQDRQILLVELQVILDIVLVFPTYNIGNDCTVISVKLANLRSFVNKTAFKDCAVAAIIASANRSL